MVYFMMQVTPISFSALFPNEYSDIHVNFSILNSRQEKHDAPVVTKVDVEVAVDTVFATTLRAFTFCNQGSILVFFFFLLFFLIKMIFFFFLVSFQLVFQP